MKRYYRVISRVPERPAKDTMSIGIAPQPSTAAADNPVNRFMTDTGFEPASGWQTFTSPLLTRKLLAQQLAKALRRRHRTGTHEVQTIEDEGGEKRPTDNAAAEAVVERAFGKRRRDLALRRGKRPA